MRINKIINGYVVQAYDTETGECESQKFVAGDDVGWEESDTEDPIGPPDRFIKLYHPMDMVQPEPLPACYGEDYDANDPFCADCDYKVACMKICNQKKVKPGEGMKDAGI